VGADDARVLDQVMWARGALGELKRWSMGHNGVVDNERNILE
jgi:hypothetical protein